jgi:G3E family GTPase
MRASKTTLLNQMLAKREGRGVAVIVNDGGEVNVDAELVRQMPEPIRWTLKELACLPPNNAESTTEYQRL